MREVESMRQGLAQFMAGNATPASLLGLSRRTLNGLYAMGIEAKADGRYDAADELFVRCVQLDPMCGTFWKALAATRQAQERLTDAADYYQLAAMFGDDTRCFAYAAACYVALGDLERANSLAQYVRESCDDVDSVNEWLAVVDRANEEAGR